MATLEEIYEKVRSDESERAALTEALASAEAVRAFLAAHGCDATVEEAVEFLRSKVGEISDDELDAVAGGGCSIAGGDDFDWSNINYAW